MSAGASSGAPELTLAPSGALETATIFASGGFASAGSGCLPLGSFADAGRSQSGVFRTGSSGGVIALDFPQEPSRSGSLKFFGDMTPADLLDDSKLAERHRRVQGVVDDLSPVSDAGTEETQPSVIQRAVEQAAGIAAS